MGENIYFRHISQFLRYEFFEVMVSPLIVAEFCIISNVRGSTLVVRPLSQIGIKFIVVIMIDVAQFV